MTEQDQLNAFLLGRIAGLEAILLALLIGSPDRDSLKQSAKLFLESSVANALPSTASDAEIEAACRGRERTIFAVLGVSPPE